MKTLLLLAICFSSLTAFSAVNINSIVLGVSLDPSRDQFHFPCSVESSDVVFCGENILIEDSMCSKSLNYKIIASKAVDISCQLSDGRNVVLAQAEGELTIDHTQDAFGHVRLKMNPDISIKSIDENGSNVKYLLIVK